MNESIAKMISASRVVVGKRQVERGLSEGNIRCVVLASDADEALKTQLSARAKALGVPVSTVNSKIELGKLVGIEVAAATVGILK